MVEPNHVLVMLMISFYKLELSKTHDQWDHALDHYEDARDNAIDRQIDESRCALDDAYFEFSLVDGTLTALCTILKN